MGMSPEKTKPLIRPEHFPAAPELLALDMDGTLLRDDHSISELTKRLIGEALDAGLRVVLASSRPPLAILPYVDDLELFGGPIVALQGALICKYENPKELSIIEQRKIDLHDALRLLDICDAVGAATSWYDAEQWTAAKIDSYILEEARIVGFRPRVDDLRAQSLGPAKILVTSNDGALRRVSEFLEAQLPHLNPSASKPEYLEITPQGVDKAGALERVCRGLGVNQRSTVVVGDGDNDLEMLAWAATSVAPANATRAASRLAGFSTTSNMEDGVALVIQAVMDRRK